MIVLYNSEYNHYRDLRNITNIIMGCIFSYYNKIYKEEYIFNNKIDDNNVIDNVITDDNIILPKELKYILNQNTLDVQKKFYEILFGKISDTDGVGFIYGFTKDNDNRWIKIGRTIHNNPNKRVDQWNGDILFCQKTLYNKKIERLIHLLFKSKNIYRLNNKTGKKEIEWFYFDNNNNNINVPKILAILIEFVEYKISKNYTITTPSHVV
jgi:hypothetical protein